MATIRDVSKATARALVEGHAENGYIARAPGSFSRQGDDELVSVNTAIHHVNNANSVTWSGLLGDDYGLYVHVDMMVYPGHHYMTNHHYKVPLPLIHDPSMAVSL